ncbi:ATP-grasp domain-containing protein [Actinophytocola glycyrrhizae]|uniref:Acetyl-CoA carboxylase biotin carboxylase subunit family protein n=1 Tax=Actinophytocola glycyrrhizae TaxID=2044873 RepID=A0ABV9S344_9PSEU
MTFLVLNRRPILDRIPDWLDDLGHDLVLVTARSVAPDRVLEEVAGRYREVVVIDDYDHSDVERLALSLAQRHRVERVLTTAEIDVLRAARIRERLGLPGQGVESATAYRDKFVMKTIAARAGIPVARMRPVRSAADLRALAEEGGFPIVVKPLAGAGSVGVRVVPDHPALDRLVAELGEIVPGRLLAETWVSGEVLVVDGLMAGGKLLQCWPIRLRYPNLAAATDGKPNTGWMLRRGDELGERLLAFVSEVVAALPAPEEVTGVHAEVFHTADGRLVLDEIASRPGGTGHTPTFERAFGVNLYGASLRGQAGWYDADELARQPRALVGFAFFMRRHGRLVEVPAACPLPGVVDFTSTARAGAEYAAPRSITDFLARILVEAPHGTDLDGPVSEVAEWWGSACRWAPPDVQPGNVSG